jgi:proteic killer suppression protein
VIRSFRSKALQAFWEQSDASKLRHDWVGRIARQLDQLEQARRPEEMHLPSNGFHELKGDQRRRYSIAVSRNWRITFTWDDTDATNVDLEDYHLGR